MYRKKIAKQSNFIPTQKPKFTDAGAIQDPIQNMVMVDRDLKQLFSYVNDLPQYATTGTDAPSSTPIKIGDMFIDTANNKVYVSCGTTNSADWRILN